MPPNDVEDLVLMTMVNWTASNETSLLWLVSDSDKDRQLFEHHFDSVVTDKSPDVSSILL